MTSKSKQFHRLYQASICCSFKQYGCTQSVWVFLAMFANSIPCSASKPYLELGSSLLEGRVVCSLPTSSLHQSPLIVRELLCLVRILCRWSLGGLLVTIKQSVRWPELVTSALMWENALSLEEEEQLHGRKSLDFKPEKIQSVLSRLKPIGPKNQHQRPLGVRATSIRQSAKKQSHSYIQMELNQIHDDYVWKQVHSYEV